MPHTAPQQRAEGRWKLLTELRGPLLSVRGAAGAGGWSWRRAARRSTALPGASAVNIPPSPPPPPCLPASRRGSGMRFQGALRILYREPGRQGGCGAVTLCQCGRMMTRMPPRLAMADEVAGTLDRLVSWPETEVPGCVSFSSGEGRQVEVEGVGNLQPFACWACAAMERTRCSAVHPPHSVTGSVCPLRCVGRLQEVEGAFPPLASFVFVFTLPSCDSLTRGSRRPWHAVCGARGTGACRITSAPADPPATLAMHTRAAQLTAPTAKPAGARLA